MSTPPTTRTTLPHDLSAPRLARRWVSEQLNPLGLDPATHEGTVLLVSELVTNVVRHTASAPVVSLRVEPDQIVVGVEDGSIEPAAIRTPEVESPGGWGLRIVDDVADRWGARVTADGHKVVWFAMAKVA